MANTVETISEESEKEGKHLTFSLADKGYGVGILKIKEIIGMMPITPVPRTPEYVKRVINLHGRVIPVLDLRLRFGIEQKESASTNVPNTAPNTVPSTVLHPFTLINGQVRPGQIQGATPRQVTP